MKKKKQRVQKSTQLQEEDLQEEMLPLEHTEKRGNKVVTVIKSTPAAYVVDLKGKVVSYIDKCDK